MELHNGHLNIVAIGKNVKKEEKKRSGLTSIIKITDNYILT